MEKKMKTLIKRIMNPWRAETALAHDNRVEVLYRHKMPVTPFKVFPPYI